MSDPVDVTTAAALRRDFDRAFAEPRAVTKTASEDIIRLRLGGDRYGMLLRDVTGLWVDLIVAPLPSPVPALAGIAGVRGRILAVYDLALLLSYPRSDHLRWLVSLAGSADVAVAFAAFEGHLRVPAGEILPVTQTGDHRPHTTHVVNTQDGALPLIAVASLLQSIHKLAHVGETDKEP